jgi:hypothetical protein
MLRARGAATRLRALIFAASTVLVLAGGLRNAALALGAAFPIVGGLAQLLPDNPFMPPEVRGPHAIEVGVSNFQFGAIAAALPTRGAKGAAAG